ncbi:protein ORF88 [Lake sturgeon herpesvirus]|nr:protein ORF88 [Lake sturgeon herpesvirus]
MSKNKQARLLKQVLKKQTLKAVQFKDYNNNIIENDNDNFNGGASYNSIIIASSEPLFNSINNEVYSNRVLLDEHITDVARHDTEDMELKKIRDYMHKQEEEKLAQQQELLRQKEEEQRLKDIKKKEKEEAERLENEEAQKVKREREEAQRQEDLLKKEKEAERQQNLKEKEKEEAQRQKELKEQKIAMIKQQKEYLKQEVERLENAQKLRREETERQLLAKQQEIKAQREQEEKMLKEQLAKEEKEKQQLYLLQQKEEQERLAEIKQKQLLEETNNKLKREAEALALMIAQQLEAENAQILEEEQNIRKELEKQHEEELKALAEKQKEIEAKELEMLNQEKEEEIKIAQIKKDLETDKQTLEEIKKKTQEQKDNLFEKEKQININKEKELDKKYEEEYKTLMLKQTQLEDKYKSQYKKLNEEENRLQAISVSIKKEFVLLERQSQNPLLTQEEIEQIKIKHTDLKRNYNELNRANESFKTNITETDKKYKEAQKQFNNLVQQHLVNVKQHKENIKQRNVEEQQYKEQQTNRIKEEQIKWEKKQKKLKDAEEERQEKKKQRELKKLQVKQQEQLEQEDKMNKKKALFEKKKEELRQKQRELNLQKQKQQEQKQAQILKNQQQLEQLKIEEIKRKKREEEIINKQKLLELESKKLIEQERQKRLARQKAEREKEHNNSELQPILEARESNIEALNDLTPVIIPPPVITETTLKYPTISCEVIDVNHLTQDTFDHIANNIKVLESQIPTDAINKELDGLYSSLNIYLTNYITWTLVEPPSNKKFLKAWLSYCKSAFQFVINNYICFADEKILMENIIEHYYLALLKNISLSNIDTTEIITAYINQMKPYLSTNIEDIYHIINKKCDELYEMRKNNRLYNQNSTYIIAVEEHLQNEENRLSSNTKKLQTTDIVKNNALLTSISNIINYKINYCNFVTNRVKTKPIITPAGELIYKPLQKNEPLPHSLKLWLGDLLNSMCGLFDKTMVVSPAGLHLLTCHILIKYFNPENSEWNWVIDEILSSLYKPTDPEIIMFNHGVDTQKAFVIDCVKTKIDHNMYEHNLTHSWFDWTNDNEVEFIGTQRIQNLQELKLENMHIHNTDKMYDVWYNVNYANLKQFKDNIIYLYQWNVFVSKMLETVNLNSDLAVDVDHAVNTLSLLIIKLDFVFENSIILTPSCLLNIIHRLLTKHRDRSLKEILFSKENLKNPVYHRLQKKLMYINGQFFHISITNQPELHDLELISIEEANKGNGPDPGANPGANPGPNPGANPGPNPGANPGPDPGSNPGPDPGPNPGANPGPDPGSNPGPDPGPDPGANPGPDPGANPGPAPGPDLDLDLEIDPNSGPTPGPPNKPPPPPPPPPPLDKDFEANNKPTTNSFFSGKDFGNALSKAANNMSNLFQNNPTRSLRSIGPTGNLNLLKKPRPAKKLKSLPAKPQSLMNDLVNTLTKRRGKMSGDDDEEEQKRQEISAVGIQRLLTEQQEAYNKRLEEQNEESEFDN